MTPEQAHAAHLAYDRLHDYLCSAGGAPVASDMELMESIYGNLLAAETLVGILAKLRRKTFDQTLDDLPERDEGYPPGPMHINSWLCRPDWLPVDDLDLAFRGSFNLVVASMTEVTAETKTSARLLACVFRDAAAAENELARIGRSIIEAGERPHLLSEPCQPVSKTIDPSEVGADGAPRHYPT